MVSVLQALWGFVAGDTCPICRGKIQSLGRRERGFKTNLALLCFVVFFSSLGHAGVSVLPNFKHSCYAYVRGPDCWSSELNLPCFDQLREKSHKISPSEAGMGSWLFKWTCGNHGNREPTLPDWDFVEIM